MTTPTRFRKLPIEIQAMQWTGDNEAELTAFTGPTYFRAVDPEDRIEDSEITAEVFDELHSTWVGVYTGHWVVRGIRGEFYPIEQSVLAESYELVEAP